MCQSQSPWHSFLFLTTRKTRLYYCSWLCRSQSAMWFDFGSSVTSSASGSLAGTVLAVDVYLACFVWVRISVRLFLTYLSVLIVLRGIFATKGNHHLFLKEFCTRSLHLLKTWVWGSLSLKLAVSSTLKETSRAYCHRVAPTVWSLSFPDASHSTRYLSTSNHISAPKMPPFRAAISVP